MLQVSGVDNHFGNIFENNNKSIKEELNTQISKLSESLGIFESSLIGDFIQNKDKVILLIFETKEEIKLRKDFLNWINRFESNTF